MTDSEVLEGTQDAQSQSSEAETGQRSSEAEYITVEQFNALSKRLDLILQTAQSEKDRAVKRTNQRLDQFEGNLKEVLQLAKKDGRSIEDLLADAEKEEEAKFRQTVNEISQVLKTGKFPTVESHGSEQTEGVNVSDVLKTLELDLDDTRVKEFAGRKFSSQAEAYRAGALLIKTISTKKPTEADRASDPSERARASGKQEQLMAEYKEKSKKVRGQALINLKVEMRKKGLNIS